MVPTVLLQAVDGCDVVGGHPTLAVLGAHFAPLSILIVAQHTQLLTWTQEEECVRQILTHPLHKVGAAA